MFILSIVLFIVIVVLIYLFPLVVVCGDSMYPFLKDGDIILGCRFILKFVKDDVYIYCPPNSSIKSNYLVVKRLSRISSNTGKLFFEGDNSECSYDSRMYGYVPKNRVKAHYICTISKKEVQK